MKRSDFEKDRFAGINWPKYEEGDQEYLQIGMIMGIICQLGRGMPASQCRIFIYNGKFSLAQLIPNLTKQTDRHPKQARWLR